MSMWWKMCWRVWFEELEEEVVWPPEPPEEDEWEIFFLSDNLLLDTTDIDMTVESSLRMGIESAALTVIGGVVLKGWPVWPPANLQLASDGGIQMQLSFAYTMEIDSAALTIETSDLEWGWPVWPPANLFIATDAEIDMRLGTAPFSMTIGSAALAVTETDISLWQSLPFFAEVGYENPLPASTTHTCVLSRFNGGTPDTVIMHTAWGDGTNEVRGTSCRYSIGFSSSDDDEGTISISQADLLGATNSHFNMRDDYALTATILDGSDDFKRTSITSKSADAFGLTSVNGDLNGEGEDQLNWVAIGGIESKLIRIGIGEGDIGGGECWYEHGLDEAPTALLFLASTRHDDETGGLELGTILGGTTFTLGMWAENGGVWSQTVGGRDAAGNTDEHSYATASYPFYGFMNRTTGAVSTAATVENVDSKYIVLRWDPLDVNSIGMDVFVLCFTKVRAFVGDDSFPTSGALTLADDAGFTPQLAIFANQGRDNLDQREASQLFFFGGDDGVESNCEGYRYEDSASWTNVLRCSSRSDGLAAYNPGGSISPSSNARRMRAKINTFSTQSTFTVLTYPPAATPFGYMMMAPARLGDTVIRDQDIYGDNYGPEYD